jgi:hypothetical protein
VLGDNFLQEVLSSTQATTVVVWVVKCEDFFPV